MHSAHSTVHTAPEPVPEPESAPVQLIHIIHIHIHIIHINIEHCTVHTTHLYCMLHTYQELDEFEVKLVAAVYVRHRQSLTATENLCLSEKVCVCHSPSVKGKPSDHKIVKVLPVSSFQNQSARVTRRVEVQPLLDSGISKMKNWLVGEKWESVLNAKTANEKVEVFENILKEKYNECFPKKTIRNS